MKSKAIIEVLSEAGVRGLSGYGEVIKGLCPFHRGSSGKTLWVGVENGWWGCWSTRCPHHKPKKLLHLFRALGHGERSAQNLVSRIGVLEVSDKWKTAGGTPTTLRGRDHEGVLGEGHIIGWRIDWTGNADEYAEAPPYVYLKSRGVNPSALDELEVGYDGGVRAFVFNLRLPDGTLCGITRKEPRPKSPYIASGSPYPAGHLLYQRRHVPKGKVLWGLWEQREEIAQGVPVVVVEGFFDVLKLRSFGVCAVAKMGSRLTETQATLLMGLDNRLIFWPDNDREGLRGTSLDVTRLLAADVRCVVPQSSDPGDTAEQGIEAALSTCIPPADWLQNLPKMVGYL